MIRIKRDFSTLAHEHCNEIKNRLPIEEKLDEQINKRSGIDKKFYSYLLSNLDLILEGNIIQLRSTVIPGVNQILGKKFFLAKNGNKKVNKAETDILKTIFDYKRFSERRANLYCSYDLVEKLDIKVCPYCNRQFVNTLRPKGKKGGSRATLDHFFLKSNYPYLALSFWNLIPSCYSCNSQLRGQRDIGLHPYYIGFDKLMKFKTDIAVISDFINNGRKDFSLSLDPCIVPKHLQFLIDKAKKNDEVFRLNELYQNHKEEVRELIQNAIVYDKSNSESLYKQFPKLFNDAGDARKMMVGNYTEEKDFEKRPLAKLMSDISKEIGLV